MPLEARRTDSARRAMKRLSRNNSTTSERREARPVANRVSRSMTDTATRGPAGATYLSNAKHWYNPYDHNMLKGDLPIIGNDYFVILSAVSTTRSSFDERHRPRTSAQPIRTVNNFLGRPESFSFTQTLQVSFEFFKGQTVFRPRPGRSRSRRRSACRTI